jgi:hypothetical protein
VTAAGRGKLGCHVHCAWSFPVLLRLFPALGMQAHALPPLGPFPSPNWQIRPAGTTVLTQEQLFEKSFSPRPQTRAVVAGGVDTSPMAPAREIGVFPSWASERQAMPPTAG